MAKSYLCIGEEYESKDGVKVSWQRIGEIFDGKNGKQYAKIYHIPGKLINIFKDEKKSASNGAKRVNSDLEPDMDVPF